MMHVWSGLLLRMENEAQFAAVIGHEIGHYLRAHQIQQWRNLRDSSAFAAVLDMVLTGGLASLAVVGSHFSFGRSQEVEADKYGLELMVQHGYEPGEASRLWKYVEAENRADISKADRNLFFSSHPLPETRIQHLEQRAQRVAKDSSKKFQKYMDRLIRHIEPHYFEFMSNHMQLQEYEQTQELLNKHTQWGYPPALVHFFSGEMYRLRKADGDQQRALEAYTSSIDTGNAPAAAYKEVGYIHLRGGNKTQAKANFMKYLEVEPKAPDNEMIKYYIESIQ